MAYAGTSPGLYLQEIPGGPRPVAGVPASASVVSRPTSDGTALGTKDHLGSRLDKEGIHALEGADLFNPLCIPPRASEADVAAAVWTAAASYCEERHAVLIVDAPSDWGTVVQAVTGMASGVGTTNANAAICFPRLRQPNILRDGQIETFAPCGAVAGVIALTDRRVGFWQAPAGTGCGIAWRARPIGPDDK